MSETETTPLSLGALRDLAARIGRPVDVEDRNTILRAANEIEMLRAAREDTERPDDLPGDLKRLADIGDQVLAGTPLEQFELGEFEIRFVAGYCSAAVAKTHEYALPDHPALGDINRPVEIWLCPQCGECQRKVNVKAYCSGSVTERTEHTHTKMVAAVVAVQDTERLDEPTEHKPSIREDGLRYWLTCIIEEPFYRLFDWWGKRDPEQEHER